MMDSMSDLFLRGGRPWGSISGADIPIRAGVVERIEAGIEAPVGFAVVDVSGRLVLPGLVEDNFPGATRQDAAGGRGHGGVRP
jgi:cytosine/adenosine deaminase-related metal-dependent hydrolase